MYANLRERKFRNLLPADHHRPLLQHNPTLSTGIDMSGQGENQNWSYPGYEQYAPPENAGLTNLDSSDVIDWQEFDFGFSNGHGDDGQVNPEVEALLNTILQPHLNVAVGNFEPGSAWRM
jgi:hypothetical protein